MKEEFPVVDLVINTLLLPIPRGGYSTELSWQDKQKTNQTFERNGSALRLQEIESEIMGTFWMCDGDSERKYLNRRIDCVSIHDGLLCKLADAECLKKAVKERALDILGFEIEVTNKEKRFRK